MALTTASSLDEAIFIGGIPRSGTSLMRDILGSHPDVAMFPSELPLWRDIAAEVAGKDLTKRAVQEHLVDVLVQHSRMSQAGIALDGRKILDTLASRSAVTLGAVFAEALRQYAQQVGRSRWGIKDPLTEFHADRILAELPRATIVHMIRDPRDVVTSQRRMWGAAAQHVVSTVEAWRRSARLARRLATRARGYVAVRYEDLVADPPAVVRRVCEALQLTYRPDMLDRAARPSWWRISGDPAIADRPDIFTVAVGRHTAELPPADSCFIQLRAGREMTRWRYRTATVRLTARDRGRVTVLLAQEAVWRAVRLFSYGEEKRRAFHGG